MDELERYQRRLAARRRKMRILGVKNIRCICGEDDPHAFEVEHVERRKGSDFTWGTCKNCHAKKTAHEATEQPKIPLAAPTPIQKAMFALLGIIEYLEAIVDRMRLIADLLLRLDQKGIRGDE